MIINIPKIKNANENAKPKLRKDAYVMSRRYLLPTRKLNNDNNIENYLLENKTDSKYETMIKCKKSI